MSSWNAEAKLSVPLPQGEGYSYRPESSKMRKPREFISTTRQKDI
jgi:hypothetical protein